MAVKVSPKKDPAAVALGRKGGKKGGPARAAKLTAEERSEIARKAVRARWDKAGPKSERTILKPLDKRSAVGKPDTSDRAVLGLLERIKATNDPAEIRKITNKLERVIFHKQYRTA
jgi:hypothetical protein